MSKNDPIAVYRRQEKWADKQSKKPQLPAKLPEAGVVRHAYGRDATLRHIGIGAGGTVVASLVGIGIFMGYQKFAQEEYSKEKETCAAFKTDATPLDMPAVSIKSASGTTWPKADGSGAIDDVFSYEVRTDTEVRSIPLSCALMVTVDMVVDETKYSQSALSQINPDASDADLSLVFSILNNSEASPAAKQSNYSACVNELVNLESAVRANAAQFENSYFPVSYLTDTTTAHQRIEYPADSPRTPLPTEARREIMFTDESGGLLTCVKPS